jgi:hypothetical protein
VSTLNPEKPVQVQSLSLLKGRVDSAETQAWQGFQLYW